MQSIDVEKIMSEIRSEIKEKGITEEPLPFHDPYETELPFAIPQHFDKDELHNETINAMALYDTAVQPIRQAAGMKGLVKKILNKMAFYSMNSHMISQNTFNIAVVNALLQVNALAADNEVLQKKVDTLQQEIDALKAQQK